MLIYQRNNRYDERENKRGFSWRFSALLLKDKEFLIAIKMKIKKHINFHFGFVSYHNILGAFIVTLRSWVF